MYGEYNDAQNDGYQDYSDEFESDSESKGKSIRTSPSKLKQGSRINQNSTARKPRSPQTKKGRSSGANIQTSPRSQHDPVLQHNRIRMNELRNENGELRMQNEELRTEIRTLKKVQGRLARSVAKYESDEGELPRLLEKHNADVRSLRAALQKSRDRQAEAEQQRAALDEQLQRARAALKKMKGLVEEKGLAERSELQHRLSVVETQLDEKDRRCNELTHHIEVLQRTHKRELISEMVKTREAKKKVDSLTERCRKLEISLKDKNRDLGIMNMYAQRMMSTKQALVLASPRASSLENLPAQESKRTPRADKTPGKALEISPRHKRDELVAMKSEKADMENEMDLLRKKQEDIERLRKELDQHDRLEAAERARRDEEARLRRDEQARRDRELEEEFERENQRRKQDLLTRLREDAAPAEDNSGVFVTQLSGTDKPSRKPPHGPSSMPSAAPATKTDNAAPDWLRPENPVPAAVEIGRAKTADEDLDLAGPGRDPAAAKGSDTPDFLKRLPTPPQDPKVVPAASTARSETPDFLVKPPQPPAGAKPNSGGRRAPPPPPVDMGTYVPSETHQPGTGVGSTSSVKRTLPNSREIPYNFSESRESQRRKPPDVVGGIQMARKDDLMSQLFGTSVNGQNNSFNSDSSKTQNTRNDTNNNSSGKNSRGSFEENVFSSSTKAKPANAKRPLPWDLPDDNNSFGSGGNGATATVTLPLNRPKAQPANILIKPAAITTSFEDDIEEVVL